MPESLVVLIESANRAIDHDDTPMEDWTFIKSYIISDHFLKALNCLSKIPLVGKIFISYLFDHFSLSYDIIVNFIEAHGTSKKIIKRSIQNVDFTHKILMEAMK